MKAIEALADSIAQHNSYSDPTSEAYRLRNPGMLKARSIESLASATDDCHRIFTSHIGGYKALVDSLANTFRGHRRVSLREAYGKYNVEDYAAEMAVAFVQTALSDKSITLDSEIRFIFSEL